MDAFVSYEQDFKELRDSVRKRIENIGVRSGDAKRKEIGLAQEELDDAEEVLVKCLAGCSCCQKLTDRWQQSLQLTAQGLGTAASKAKVKAFEGEFAELKAQVRRAETFFGGGDADRTKLFAGSDLAVTSADQRTAVARDTERLKHTTDVIKDALRVAGETEQIGRDSLAQLHVQRETIQGSRLKIRAVDESLATAGRLMRGMARRIMTNKLITLVLALIMIGGIALLVYLKWFDNPSPDDMMTSAVNGTLAANATTTFAATNATTAI